MSEGLLTQIANTCGSDKGTEVLPCHGYSIFYEKHFAELRLKALKILEIGVFQGSSLKMWHEYFPNAKIYGVDSYLERLNPSNLVSDRIQVIKADQSRREDLQKIIDQTGGDFDIVIDDGGHRMEEQQLSMGVLFPHVKSGGLYVIEDLHTSLFPIGQPIYGRQSIDIDENRSNTTLTMIWNYQKMKLIWSAYLQASEMKTLSDSIQSCDLFDDRAVVFRKKKDC